jgi:hypothetical protein
MVFWKWWNAQQFTEAQALAYFQEWIPLPCWLNWIVGMVWQKWAYSEREITRLRPYFLQLEALGLGTEEAFWQDIKWDHPSTRWTEDGWRAYFVFDPTKPGLWPKKWSDVGSGA